MTKVKRAAKSYDVPRLTDQVRRSFEGSAWHGPSVMEALDGITAEQAAAKPLSGGHSIWEILLHTGYWIGAVQQRLLGRAISSPPPMEENFPSPPEVSEAAWNMAKERTLARHNALVKMLEDMPEERLWDSVPGKNRNFYFELMGLPQHNAYHAGQISLLKKAFENSR